jgi:hypothetical protein
LVTSHDFDADGTADQVVSQTYDSEGRLTDMETVVTAEGNNPIIAVRSRFDEHGRLASWELSGSQIEGTITRYVYDGCDRRAADRDHGRALPARDRLRVERAEHLRRGIGSWSNQPSVDRPGRSSSSRTRSNACSS